jgi:hypothetical protein
MLCTLLDWLLGELAASRQAGCRLIELALSSACLLASRSNIPQPQTCPSTVLPVLEQLLHPRLFACFSGDPDIVLPFTAAPCRDTAAAVEVAVEPEKES